MSQYTFKTCSRQTGVTPIPNIFIDEYMPSANGSFVKVYILGLTESIYDKAISGDILSRKLGLIESDIIKAWEYWETKGLIRTSKSGEDFSIEYLNPYDAYYSSIMPSKPGSPYQPEAIRLKMNNPNIKDMFESIEKLLGRILSPNEISMYMSWLDDFSFPPEIVMLLIEYCKSKNKVDSRYIEKVAMSWHDAGITSLESAQKYIGQYEDRFNKYRLVLDFLGLKENDLMKPQEDFLDKWFNQLEFSMEMVLEACKICSLRINEPNFSYIDGILSNWNKKGIKTLKDIDAVDAKKHSKNVKFKAPVNAFNSYDQRSYDIKELEKKLLGIDGEVSDEQ